MEATKDLEKSRFKRVCVFCGSSTGKRICYRDAAIELAQELVSSFFFFWLIFLFIFTKKFIFSILFWRFQEVWTLFMVVGVLGLWVWFLKLFIKVEEKLLGNFINDPFNYFRFSLILRFFKRHVFFNL